jgi:hypothetical protein
LKQGAFPYTPESANFTEEYRTFRVP